MPEEKLFIVYDYSSIFMFLDNSYFLIFMTTAVKKVLSRFIVL